MRHRCLHFILALCSLLSTTLYGFELKMEPLSNFDVEERMLEEGKAQMSITFLKPEQFKRSSMASFDRELWADIPDTQLIFVKGAFIADHPITKYRPSFYSNTRSIKKIYDANNVIPLSTDEFKVQVSRIGVSMEFIVHLYYQNYGRLLRQNHSDWIETADLIDRAVPSAEQVQIITQDSFDKIFDKSITINKLIPYGEQTMVVSYSLARAKQSAVDKINSLPFVNAQKTLAGQLKDSFKQTYKLMAE